jgi:hypothetical protein
MTKFEEFVLSLSLAKLVVHNCSFCDYDCGYFAEGQYVFYDSGCDCVKYSGIRQVTYMEILSYSSQNKYKVLKHIEDNL